MAQEVEKTTFLPPSSRSLQLEAISPYFVEYLMGRITKEMASSVPIVGGHSKIPICRAFVPSHLVQGNIHTNAEKRGLHMVTWVTISIDIHINSAFSLSNEINELQLPVLRTERWSAILLNRVLICSITHAQPARDWRIPPPVRAVSENWGDSTWIAACSKSTMYRE